MNELDEVTYKGLIVCILGNIHSPRRLSLIDVYKRQALGDVN